MAMLAGLGLEVVREHAPILQRRVLMDLWIEVIHQPALPGDVKLAIGWLHHHLAGFLPLQELAPAADENLVCRLVLDTKIALACAFNLGHRGYSAAGRRKSGDCYS